MNVYRSIGGRANTSGVERINRDGQMEKLQMGEAEVTPHERMQWNAKCTKDPRGRLPEEIYKVEKDSIGNSMSVDFVSGKGRMRVKLPTPRQYSTESRLAELRGEKVQFPKSVNNEDKAFAITPGMVFSENDTRNFDMKEAKKELKKQEENPTKAGKILTASKDLAKMNAFVKVARIVGEFGQVDNETIIEISNENQLPVEEVFVLEKIAKSNSDLAKKYAQCSCGKHVVVKKPIPGEPVAKQVGEPKQVVVSDEEEVVGVDLDPEKNPKHKKKLCDTANEVAL